MLLADLGPIEQGGPSLALTDYLTNLGLLYDRLAQHETALVYHQRAYQMAKALNARHMQVIAMQNMMYCLIQLGRMAEGIEAAEEALSLGQFARSDILRNNLAVALQRLGRYQDTVLHYEYLATHSLAPHVRASSHANLAEVWAKLGHSERVIPTLEAALHHLAQTDFPIVQAIVGMQVLYLGNDEMVARIQPILARLNPEVLDPMARANLEKAQAERRDRGRGTGDKG